MHSSLVHGTVLAASRRDLGVLPPWRKP